MGRSKVANEAVLPKPFSVEMVKQLADVMKQHDLSELVLDTDAGRLRLRRGHHDKSVVPHAMPSAPTVSAQSPGATGAESVKTSRPVLEIKSEAIGTFYSRANPESEPYVKVGSRVTPTTVVGLIEAMKMFNE